MYYINLVAKKGQEGFLDMAFMAEFNTHFLINGFWVREEIQKAGGELKGIIPVRCDDHWDAGFPHQQMRTGAIAYGVDDADGEQREWLIKKVEFILGYKDNFESIDGLGQFSHILGLSNLPDFFIEGKPGNWADLKGNSPAGRKIDPVWQFCQEMPETDKNLLWDAVTQAREEINPRTWFILKNMWLPWQKMSAEQALYEVRMPFWKKGTPLAGQPSQFELERLLRRAA